MRYHLRRVIAHAVLFVAVVSPVRGSIVHDLPQRLLAQPVEKLLTRTVQGAVEEVWVEHHRSKKLTVLLIIDFSTDVWWQPPRPTPLRFCGDRNSVLNNLVHANISITYSPASPSRSTDCLTLIKAEQLQDNSPWEKFIILPREIPVRLDP